MTKQCPSCGGDCGRTKHGTCQYEAPIHKEVRPPRRVGQEGWDAYNALVDRLLTGTPHQHIEDYLKELGK